MTTISIDDKLHEILQATARCQGLSLTEYLHWIASHSPALTPDHALQAELHKRLRACIDAIESAPDVPNEIPKLKGRSAEFAAAMMKNIAPSDKHMTLCDAGPLIALLDPADRFHQVISRTIDGVDLPLITTWPALTEAAYFLYNSGGWPRQRKLWNLIVTGVLNMHSTSVDEQFRMQALMEQYHDVPMDLADASLVAAAEALKLREIVTLDSDFRIYRPAGGEFFQIIPD